MDPTVKNWIATSNYDLRTAEAMLKAGRYLYVVFMCHLSVEKMLKGIIAHQQPETIPPKTHQLIFLAQKAHLEIPEEFKVFIQHIDNVSVVTRYPEDLRKLAKEFNRAAAQRILSETRALLQWLRQCLKSEE